jgi:integrase
MFTHAVWRNVEGNTTTEASRKPVPIPEPVVEELRQWRSATLYHGDRLYLPIGRKVRDTAHYSRHDPETSHSAGAEAVGVTKRIGFHSFRHGLALMLRQKGVDIKTAQELLRYANSRITLEVYQQAVGSEKRLAQNVAFQGLLTGGSTQHPSAPLEVV